MTTRAAAFHAFRLRDLNWKSPSQSLIRRRGFAAGAADHHGPPKVNCWEDPMSPSKWKEEHFVIVSLAGWGVFIYGAFKFFKGVGNKNAANKSETSQN